MREATAIRDPWRPSADEVAGILAEMRPIINEFTRRSAAFLATASHDAMLRSPALATR